MGGTTTTETVTIPRRTSEKLLMFLRHLRDYQRSYLREDFYRRGLADDFSRVEREMMDAMGR